MTIFFLLRKAQGVVFSRVEISHLRTNTQLYKYD